jgi:hypothetical protein
MPAINGIIISTDHHCGFKKIVADTVVIIEENKQSVTFGGMILDGTLVIDGELILA